MGKNDPCGGYKITVQNHVCSGEFKYNVYDTGNGELWQSNDTDCFVEKLEEILNKVG